MPLAIDEANCHIRKRQYNRLLATRTEPLEWHIQDQSPIHLADVIRQVPVEWRLSYHVQVLAMLLLFQRLYDWSGLVKEGDAFENTPGRLLARLEIAQRYHVIHEQYDVAQLPVLNV